MILPIHVAAGGIAIVAGGLAIAARKGGSLHRRSGTSFVGAMLVLGVTAALLGNVAGGLMSIYFSGTAYTTVRPVSPWTRAFGVGALLFVAGFALILIAGGIDALGRPNGARDGVPFAMFFFLAAVSMLAAIGDVRVLRSGTPRGGRRLARHLWRMCFALFIAAGSFFSIEARVASILPAPFTTLPMRMLPIVLPFAAMGYWLWRVRRSPTLGPGYRRLRIE